MAMIAQGRRRIAALLALLAIAGIAGGSIYAGVAAGAEGQDSVVTQAADPAPAQPGDQITLAEAPGNDSIPVP